MLDTSKGGLGGKAKKIARLFTDELRTDVSQYQRQGSVNGIGRKFGES